MNSFAPVVALSFLAACASSVRPENSSDAAVDSPTAVVDVGPDVGFPHPTPAHANPILCPADAGITFAPALATCTAVADCVAVVQGLDCCGSIGFVGINRGQQSAYAAAEGACESAVRFNMCRCAAREPVTQDGRVVQSLANARLVCVAGTCNTRAP